MNSIPEPRLEPPEDDQDFDSWWTEVERLWGREIPEAITDQQMEDWWHNDFSPDDAIIRISRLGVDKS